MVELESKPINSEFTKVLYQDNNYFIIVSVQNNTKARMNKKVFTKFSEAYARFSLIN